MVQGICITKEGLKDGKMEVEKGNFLISNWVLNADRYDLKINNEHMQYMDMLDPDFLHPVPAQDKQGWKN